MRRRWIEMMTRRTLEIPTTMSSVDTQGRCHRGRGDPFAGSIQAMWEVLWTVAEPSWSSTLWCLWEEPTFFYLHTQGSLLSPTVVFVAQITFIANLLLKPHAAKVQIFHSIVCMVEQQLVGLGNRFLIRNQSCSRSVDGPRSFMKIPLT